MFRHFVPLSSTPEVVRSSGPEGPGVRRQERQNDALHAATLFNQDVVNRLAGDRRAARLQALLVGQYETQQLLTVLRESVAELVSGGTAGWEDVPPRLAAVLGELGATFDRIAAG